MKRRPPPGSEFRLQYQLQDRARTMVTLRSKDYRSANAPGPDTLPVRAVFDEIVVSPFLHLEQMDRNCWWVQICDRCFSIFVDKDGKARITYEETR